MRFKILLLVLFACSTLQTFAKEDFAVAGIIKFTKKEKPSPTKKEKPSPCDIMLCFAKVEKVNKIFQCTYFQGFQSFIFVNERGQSIIDSNSVLPEDNVKLNASKGLKDYKEKKEKIKKQYIRGDFYAENYKAKVTIDKEVKNANVMILFAIDNVIYQLNIDKKIEFNKNIYFVSYAPKKWKQKDFLKTISDTFENKLKNGFFYKFNWTFSKPK